jgi:hypothetical protein
LPWEQSATTGAHDIENDQPDLMLSLTELLVRLLGLAGEPLDRGFPPAAPQAWPRRLNLSRLGTSPTSPASK